MYRITLYQYTGFRSLWLEVLYYGGAIPARTSPPEGGLRSWPNERPGDSSSAGRQGKNGTSELGGKLLNKISFGFSH